MSSTADRSWLGSSMTGDFQTQLDSAVSVALSLTINPVLKPDEHFINRRMRDRPSLAVRFKMSLSDISIILAAIYQNAVPRLIFRWSGTRDLVIPGIGALKSCVHVDDHPAIIKPLVMHDLADEELGMSAHALPTPDIRLSRFRNNNGAPWRRVFFNSQVGIGRIEKICK